MRANYWSLSKFGTWIRGTEYPEYASSEGWTSISTIAKATHPVRYWIAETLLDKIQDVVMFPQDTYYNIKYYIDNRWITKTHALTAHPQDIKPGTWQDLGGRFLPCMFNELVNFVEIELAWSYIRWDDEHAKEKYNYPDRWFGHVRGWRCKQAGLDYLQWASSITYPDSESNFPRLSHQAVVAIELARLYTWWTEERPNRVDPSDTSGINEFYDNDTGDIFRDRPPEEDAKLKSMREIEHEIEQKYQIEDTEMMIRLIKIRDGLWT
jgi:hypothetical protein